MQGHLGGYQMDAKAHVPQEPGKGSVKFITEPTAVPADNFIQQVCVVQLYRFISVNAQVLKGNMEQVVVVYPGKPVCVGRRYGFQSYSFEVGKNIHVAEKRKI